MAGAWESKRPRIFEAQNLPELQLSQDERCGTVRPPRRRPGKPVVVLEAI